LSRGPRLALIAVAIAVAALAFVLARPDDDSNGGGAAKTTPATAPSDTGNGGAKAGEQPPPRPTYERVRIRGGQPVGGVKDITVTKGDTVRLAVSSDTADEVHVHGYDLKKDVEAGSTVRFRFPADVEGVFEIELEGTHVQIAKLTVEP
jgi:FtsP/CotA-like multicopper oxidase with cupredoxin domain